VTSGRSGARSPSLPIERVLAWRVRRQLLDRPAGIGVTDVVTRLCGVQAQVASSAELAVAQRLVDPGPGGVSKALQDRVLVKTWAMRGTLHVLPAAGAADYLSLLAAPRSWEKAAWQRTFATAQQIEAIAEAAQEALQGRPLTREALSAEIVRLTADDSLAELLASGWGTVLKPLAWQGLLVNGPSEGNRVTFTSPRAWLPGWPGLPEPDAAAARVVPAYLGAFGPATAEAFDQWLLRGATRRASLRAWFAGLVAAGTVARVDVEGLPAYARAEDVDEIAATEPSDEVHLLPAFDQYVLGPGTGDGRIVAPERRGAISRAGGWIAPVVVWRGRVAGTWEVADGTLRVAVFRESDDVPRRGLDAAAERLATRVGTPLTVSVGVT